MSKPDKGDRRAAYLARQKDKGLVQVKVLVPASRAEELKEIAAKMRKERKDDGQ